MVFKLFKKLKKRAPVSSHELEVKDILVQTSDSVTLVLYQTQPPIQYKPGQFLTLILSVDGKEIRRSYSLNSSPYVDKDLEITVKRVEHGLISNWLIDHLKKGDRIRAIGPTGNFTTEYHPSQKRNLVFVAGGSGITPILSMLKSVLTQEPKSRCTLVYCNRNVESVIFKNQLEEWQTQYADRFHVIHMLDTPPSEEWYAGPPTTEKLAHVMAAIPADNIQQATCFLCGPSALMDNAQTVLQQLQVPIDKILRESFVSAPQKSKVSPAHQLTRSVVIRYNGEEHTIQVPPGSTILESAIDQHIELPYSCQSGICTACRGKALSGQVNIDDQEGLSDEEVQQGYVLTCIGVPMTDDVVIEIG